MGFIRTQASFLRDTGDPADTQVNTWHFFGGTSTAEEDHTAAVTALTAFYQAIDQFMGTSMFNNPMTLTSYNLEDETPRVPIGVNEVTLTFGTSGESLPAETSMVLSFQGDKISGVNQARRRGRVFLPTFLPAQLGLGAGRPIWTAATVTQVVSAAEGIPTSLGLNTFWAVFSDTTFTEGAGLTASMTEVQNGWVDNEPDTQRRRGGPGGARTTFSFAV